MKLYLPSDKIQVSVIEIAIETNNTLSDRSIKLYYESDESKHTNFILPTPQIIDGNIIPKLNWYYQHRGIAMENAESNFNYLSQVLTKYFSTRVYPTESKPLEHLDFMGKRNLLSNWLIKKDEMFHDIQELMTVRSRKKFTSLFYEYILDRNIFAHGIFVFCIIKNNFYIEHKRPATYETVYAVMTNETLSSFLKAASI